MCHLLWTKTLCMTTNGFCWQNIYKDIFAYFYIAAVNWFWLCWREWLLLWYKGWKSRRYINAVWSARICIGVDKLINYFFVVSDRYNLEGIQFFAHLFCLYNSLLFKYQDQGIYHFARNKMGHAKKIFLKHFMAIWFSKQYRC